MPRIPSYTPQETTRPQPFYQREPGGLDQAVGVGQGRALQQSGSDIMQLGAQLNTQFKQNQIEDNEREARLLSIEYTRRMREVTYGTETEPGFYSTKQLDAINGIGDAEARIRTIREELMAQAPNDRVAELFGLSSAVMAEQEFGQMYAHTAKERTAANISAIDAQAQDLSDNAVLHYNNPEIVAQSINGVAALARESADLQGLSPEATESLVRTANSKLVANLITQAISSEDEVTAINLFTSMKDMLSAEELPAISKSINDATIDLRVQEAFELMPPGMNALDQVRWAQANFSGSLEEGVINKITTMGNLAYQELQRSIWLADLQAERELIPDFLALSTIVDENTPYAERMRLAAELNPQNAAQIVNMLDQSFRLHQQQTEQYALDAAQVTLEKLASDRGLFNADNTPDITQLPLEAVMSEAFALGRGGNIEARDAMIALWADIFGKTEAEANATFNRISRDIAAQSKVLFEMMPKDGTIESKIDWLDKNATDRNVRLNVLQMLGQEINATSVMEDREKDLAVLNAAMEYYGVTTAEGVAVAEAKRVNDSQALSLIAQQISVANAQDTQSAQNIMRDMRVWLFERIQEITAATPEGPHSTLVEQRMQLNELWSALQKEFPKEMAFLRGRYDDLELFKTQYTAMTANAGYAEVSDPVSLQNIAYMGVESMAALNPNVYIGQLTSADFQSLVGKVTAAQAAISGASKETYDRLLEKTKSLLKGQFDWDSKTEADQIRRAAIENELAVYASLNPLASNTDIISKAVSMMRTSDTPNNAPTSWWVDNETAFRSLSLSAQGEVTRAVQPFIEQGILEYGKVYGEHGYSLMYEAALAWEERDLDLYKELLNELLNDPGLRPGVGIPIRGNLGGQ